MRGGAAMDMVVRMLLLGLVVMALGVIGGASAQTPTPAQTPAPTPPATPVPIVGNIYSVAYVEVMPTSKDDAAGGPPRHPRAAPKAGGHTPPPAAPSHQR